MPEEFGYTKNGVLTHAYTISNQAGMQVKITDYGATVISIMVKDKQGAVQDVSLGYDSVKDYEEHGYYFGAIIGRNSNRIANGQCVIDGVTYQMDQNHNENNLHSGLQGLDVVVWKADFDEAKPDTITFSYLSKDMEQKLPGNFDVQVTYQVTEENVLRILYHATTDRTTLANMTTHIYYNLNGHAAGNIEGHQLMIPGSKYTPMIDAKAIPKGFHEVVAGTPFDFTEMKKIGQDIDDASDEQIGFAAGYDHNFVIDAPAGQLRTCAKAVGDESGIALEIVSDCEGIQFYSGNFIGEHTAKNGASYGRRQGFALEPQYIPNAINVEEWTSPILRPGEEYISETQLRFTVV